MVSKSALVVVRGNRKVGYVYPIKFDNPISKLTFKLGKISKSSKISYR